MIKESATSNIFLSGLRSITKDRLIAPLFMSGAKPSDSSLSHVTFIPGITGKRNSMLSTITFKRTDMLRNVAVPYVYKGLSFHSIMPKVFLSGSFHQSTYGRIFWNGKWRILTTNLNMKQETQNSTIVVHGEDVRKDSVVGIISIEV